MIYIPYKPEILLGILKETRNNLMKRKTGGLLPIIIFMLLGSLTYLYPNYFKSTDASHNSTVNLEKAEVVKHVDGDTIYVKLSDGTQTKVRFIGINTPESTNETEPYGKESSDFTKNMLFGKTIYLEKDVSETDRYGRTLRYIWLTPPLEISESEIRNKMFNAILVLEGYAQATTYPPDVKYSKHFADFQKEAREDNKGLWGLQ
jgi:micrococcal nuclease